MKESVFRVPERHSFTFEARLEDENGVAIPLADLTDIVVTLFNKADAAIINSRNAQSLKNISNGTYTQKSGTVTAATNASPIVVTSTAHGLVSDDVVFITGALGNDAANGKYKTTKIDADSFSLDGTTGDGAHVASTGTWSFSRFKWSVQPADNAIIGTGFPIGAIEEHVAVLKWTWTGGEGYHKIRILVENLNKVP